MRGKELRHNGTFVKELGPEIVLKEAILIQGLPGMGFVGHLSARFLIDEFEAVEFARIYSSYFPSIVILRNGEGKLVRIELFAVEKVEPNLIIMTGDVQPSETGMIQVLDFVLDYCASKGVKNVIAVGGLRAENGPEVAGFAFSKEDLEFLKDYDVGTLENGQVTGAVGVITALGAEKGLKSFGLLGKLHVSGPDPIAARNVLNILRQIYNLPIDLNRMEEKIEKALERERITKEFIERVKETQEEKDKPSYFI